MHPLQEKVFDYLKHQNTLDPFIQNGSIAYIVHDKAGDEKHYKVLDSSISVDDTLNRMCWAEEVMVGEAVYCGFILRAVENDTEVLNTWLDIDYSAGFANEPAYIGWQEETIAVVIFDKFNHKLFHYYTNGTHTAKEVGEEAYIEGNTLYYFGYEEPATVIVVDIPSGKELRRITKTEATEKGVVFEQL